MTMSFIAYEQYDKKNNLTTQGFWVGDGTVLVSDTSWVYARHGACRLQLLQEDRP